MLLSAEEKKEVSEAIATRVSAERDVVARETEKANQEATKVAALQSEVQQQKDDAEADLALAEPAIEAAMKALDTLDKRDLGNCKTMSTPPKGVDDVFAAVVVLLAGIQKGIPVQKTGKVKDKDRAWDAVKKSLLGNVNGLIDDLKGYKPMIDEGGVPDVNFKEVRVYLKLEHFDPEVIQKKNSAAAGLCNWVVNIVKYYDIWLDVEPKRILVQESTEKLDKANAELAIVKEQVAELQAQLDELTEEYNKADADKKEAVDTAERGKLKLELAQRLTVALGSEEVRWAAGIESLQADGELLIGDVLLSAAFISYIGPFTKVGWWLGGRCISLVARCVA
jgi:dynein heavy chain